MRAFLTHLGRSKVLSLAIAGAVVVALAVTAVGYRMMTEKVTLTVDGHPQTVHTFARTVGDVLADKGIHLGAHDLVIPSVDSEVVSGSEITVRFGRPVKVDVDGRERTYWTTATTVASALGQIGLNYPDAALSASRSSSIGREGMALQIAKPKRFVVKIGNHAAHTRKIAAFTSHDLLDRLHVKYDGNDKVRPGAGHLLKAGDHVVLTRVATHRRSVKGETMPYRTIRREDSSMTQGTSETVRNGQTGVRDVTYRVVEHNGHVFKRVVLRQHVYASPVPAIVKAIAAT